MRGATRRRGVIGLALAVLLALVSRPVGAAAAAPDGYLTVSPHEGTVAATSFLPGSVPTFSTPAGCPTGSDAYLLRLFGSGLPGGGVIWTAGDAGVSLSATFTVNSGMSIADATAGSIAATALAGTYEVRLDCIASADPQTALAEFTTTLSIDGAANHWVAGTNPDETTSSTADPQTVEVSVPQGSLVLSTPYTPDHPFVLDGLHLSPDATYFTTTGAFGTLADPEDGITVLDTRAGNLGWSVSASTTDFTDATGSLINGQNLGFTDLMPVFLTDNALQSGIVATDQPAAPAVGPGDPGTLGLKGPPHLLASADHGIGSVHLIGTMTLNAPTSTAAGTYTATVTFTLV